MHRVSPQWLLFLLLFIPGLSLASDRAETAWQWIEQEAVLIDVRTPAEFDTEHLPGAINVPLQVIEEQIGTLRLPKDKAIVLYCRSGRRSGLAKDLLADLGYQQLHNGGGLVELKKAKTSMP